MAKAWLGFTLKLAGVAGLVLWATVHGPARAGLLALGIVGVSYAYWDFVREYWAEWKEGGLEHAALERAALVTLLIGLPLLWLEGFIGSLADWQPLDAMTTAAALFVMFLAVRAAVVHRRVH